MIEQPLIQEHDERVEEMKFEPIKGYPMLNWRGKRSFTSTQYYPAQIKERHGEPVEGWMNKILWGDNLQVMSHLLKEYRGQVKLVYIDPPFDSKADYKLKVQRQGKSLENDHNAFEEKQYNDIWHNDQYLQHLFERLILIKEILSANGTLYVHCDANKSHHLRCILDEVFGTTSFRNFIVWNYETSGYPKNYWAQKHDQILMYTKSSTSWTFNVDDVREPYEPDSFERNYPHTEDDGRRYRLKNGRKYYAKEGGKHPDDVWFINHVYSEEAERTRYPTQKPSALLEKIILASSCPGDIVFDCFMGSGTTQAVSMKLGRRFLGADINLGAIQTTTKRLLNVAKLLAPAEQQLIAEENDSFYLLYWVRSLQRQPL